MQPFISLRLLQQIKVLHILLLGVRTKKSSLRGPVWSWKSPSCSTTAVKVAVASSGVSGRDHQIGLIQGVTEISVLATTASKPLCGYRVTIIAQVKA